MARNSRVWSKGGFEKFRKPTKRECFFAKMDQVMPRSEADEATLHQVQDAGSRRASLSYARVREL